MQAELGFQDSQVTLWGTSVGTAVALEFAQGKEFQSIVLLSPFSSRYAMAEHRFGTAIQKFFLMPDTYVNTAYISQNASPLLLIHGNADTLIPIEQGIEVFENSPSEQKYFLEIDAFGHNGIISEYGKILEKYISQFLDSQRLEAQVTFIDSQIAARLLEEHRKLELFASFDTIHDASLQKYVSPEISFNELSYVPENLENVNLEYVIDAKGNSTLRSEALDALDALSEQYYNDFGEKVVLVSAYRSYAYQKGIKDRGCPDNLCAKA